MFLTVRGDPHSLHRREGRNLQPRQHPTTAIVAALLLCHGDGEANADMNFAVEMDENERSRRAWRTAASTRRSASRWTSPQAPRGPQRCSAREAAAASGGCEVLA
jgi:hypothetical protein